jgi:hypothetical protein
MTLSNIQLPFWSAGLGSIANVWALFPIDKQPLQQSIIDARKQQSDLHGEERCKEDYKEASYFLWEFTWTALRNQKTAL